MLLTFLPECSPMGEWPNGVFAPRHRYGDHGYDDYNEDDRPYNRRNRNINYSLPIGLLLRGIHASRVVEGEDGAQRGSTGGRRCIGLRIDGNTATRRRRSCWNQERDGNGVGRLEDGLFDGSLGILRIRRAHNIRDVVCRNVDRYHAFYRGSSGNIDKAQNKLADGRCELGV